MTGQKSQKGANDIVMKRKIYQQLLDWKEKRHGEVALLVVKGKGSTVFGGTPVW